MDRHIELKVSITTRKGKLFDFYRDKETTVIKLEIPWELILALTTLIGSVLTTLLK